MIADVWLVYGWRVSKGVFLKLMSDFKEEAAALGLISVVPARGVEFVVGYKVGALRLGTEASCVRAERPTVEMMMRLMRAMEVQGLGEISRNTDPALWLVDDYRARPEV